MKLALLITGLLMIAFTLLPLTRRDEWWIRIWDFPRLQITVLLGICAVAYTLLFWDVNVLENLFVAGLSFSLAYQGYMMFPYTPLAANQVQRSRSAMPDSTISLLFANVLQDNTNAEKLCDIVKKADPDIFLAVETNKWWQDQLCSFEEDYPYTVHVPIDNTYGMLLYSRVELIDPKVRYLVEDDIPSIHTSICLRDGTDVVLRCLHPRPPFPTEDRKSTERDAELLIVGKELKAMNKPAIVFGDLNDVAWSRTNYLFQDISGLLDPRIGRGFYNTFHANIPLIRFPLDHCFHTNHFRLVDFRRLERYGSDHYPVFIKLSHEPGAEKEQVEPAADKGELKEAKEKIASV